MLHWATGRVTGLVNTTVSHRSGQNDTSNVRRIQGTLRPVPALVLEAASLSKTKVDMSVHKVAGLARIQLIDTDSSLQEDSHHISNDHCLVHPPVLTLYSLGLSNSPLLPAQIPFRLVLAHHSAFLYRSSRAPNSAPVFASYTVASPLFNICNPTSLRKSPFLT